MREDSTFDPEVSVRVLWKSIAAMQSKFGFSRDETMAVLGGMPASTLEEGIETHSVEVSEDVKIRVSLLLGIFSGLRSLFAEEQQATGWIDRVNSEAPFNGTRPRDLITSGRLSDLQSVRRFLDFQYQT